MIGTFHVVCAYFKMIGKKMEGTGLSDILLEAGLIGSGSVTGVMTGKHYSRAMHCHKILLETEFLPLIYPPELEIKETTDTASSASFLDLYLEIDDSGQLSTKIYDKRNDFNFKIINFPNMCSNIPASAYGVYISQLIRYARASSNYSDFLKRHLYLRNRLLDQGYKKIRLIRSL